MLRAPEVLLLRVLYPNPVLYPPELMLIKEFNPNAVLVQIALLPLPNFKTLTVDAYNVTIITFLQVFSNVHQVLLQLLLE